MSTATNGLSVTLVSKLVGVSRSRVYQRIRGTHENAGRPLRASIETTNRPGTRAGRQVLVALEDAIAWRAERALQGLPVGPLSVLDG
ncbi:MAG: hypothetical protein KIS74_02920 [Burkholderiales bacterium]|nr:hypothetical protein [Burkholderiales bacterium]